MIEYHDIPPFGRVRVSRRSGSRSLRISIHQSGEVRLFLPMLTPLSEGITFLNSKTHWILKHKKEERLLGAGAIVGGRYTVRTLPSTKSVFKTYFTADQLIVYVPTAATPDQIHEKIIDAVKKRLVKQTRDSLLPYAETLALKHGYKVKSLQAKTAQSKWGHCTSQNDLMFNAYLVQLPQELIAYVLFHEFAHTIHHNHSEAFWQEVAKHIPNHKELRRRLKKYPTAIFDMRDFR